MINNVSLVGRLTKDPDLRYTPSGVAVCNFTMAINRPFKNNEGQQEADFINCVIWRAPAENLANYMSKGSLIGITGSIQTRFYDDTDGKRVFVTEVLANNVQFLESRNSNGNGSNSGGSNSTTNNTQNNQNNSNSGGNGGNTNNQPQTTPANEIASDAPLDINDDDLPF